MPIETEKLEFTCPDCGKHDLEEVLTGIVYINDVVSIDDGEVWTRHREMDGDSTRESYRCKNCGFIVKNEKDNNITDPDDLVQWIEDQQETQRRDEKRGLYPDKADISN